MASKTKQINCGFLQNIEQICGELQIGCKFCPGLRTLPVKNFGSWIQYEFLIEDSVDCLGCFVGIGDLFSDESLSLKLLPKVALKV